MNWMFFLITPLLSGMTKNEQVSYHQFVTNPSTEMLKEINNTFEVRMDNDQSLIWHNIIV